MAQSIVAWKWALQEQYRATLECNPVRATHASSHLERGHCLTTVGPVALCLNTAESAISNSRNIGIVSGVSDTGMCTFPAPLTDTPNCDTSLQCIKAANYRP